MRKASKNFFTSDVPHVFQDLPIMSLSCEKTMTTEKKYKRNKNIKYLSCHQVVKFNSKHVGMELSPNTPITVENFEPAQRFLRIAVVTETWPPEVNGVAVTLAKLVHHLGLRHHTIQLIRPRQDKHCLLYTSPSPRDCS